MAKFNKATHEVNQRPHYVDEDTETVYLHADSWGSAMAAPHWVNRFFPGYKRVMLSKEELQKKINSTNEED